MMPPEAMAYYYGVVGEPEQPEPGPELLIGHECPRCAVERPNAVNNPGRLVHVDFLDDIDDFGTVTYRCTNAFCGLVAYNLDDDAEGEAAA